jgi:hypothetical protein
LAPFVLGAVEACHERQPCRQAKGTCANMPFDKLRTNGGIYRHLVLGREPIEGTTASVQSRTFRQTMEALESGHPFA